MDILEAIFTRRSIRKFTGVTISDEELETILRAGFSAPSANNQQPWHFVVVRDKAKLEEISASHPYAKMLPKAGCGIVVCGDLKIQGMAGFLVEDCSAAIENMLLAAHGMGLGAVWCGLYPLTERARPVANILNLPGDIVPVALVVVGNKDEEKDVVNRFNKKKVHFDRW